MGDWEWYWLVIACVKLAFAHAHSFYFGRLSSSARSNLSRIKSEQGRTRGIGHSFVGSAVLTDAGKSVIMKIENSVKETPY